MVKQFPWGTLKVNRKKNFARKFLGLHNIPNGAPNEDLIQLALEFIRVCT